MMTDRLTSFNVFLFLSQILEYVISKVALFVTQIKISSNHKTVLFFKIGYF